MLHDTRTASSAFLSTAAAAAAASLSCEIFFNFVFTLFKLLFYNFIKCAGSRTFERMN
jgi:hypothetical protein